MTIAKSEPSTGSQVAGPRSSPSTRNPPSRAGRIAIAIIATLGFAFPYFSDQYWLGIGTEVLIFAIAAMGLNVLIGQAGLVSVGHAGLFGVAAYSASISQVRLDIGFATSAVIAMAVSLAVTVLFALAAVRSTGMYFLMITLSSGMLVWGVAQRWSTFTGGENGAISGVRPEKFALYYEYYWLVYVVLLLMCSLLALLKNSNFGLRIRGSRDSATRMTAVGYSPVRERFYAFMASGAVMAVGGILYAGYWPVISPSTAHLSASIMLLLMVLAGGSGFFFGPVVGAVTLVVLRAIVSSETPRWPMVMGAVLVLVVLFARDGLSGLAHSWLVGRRRTMRASAPEKVPS